MVKNWKFSIIVLAAVLISCSNAKESKVGDESFQRTKETTKLLNLLQTVPQHGIMFGHHDDPLYGVTWIGDDDRSDVKSVCGDYPAVMSFDLGHMELGKEQSLDGIAFDKIKKEIIAQHKRGGVNSISWHLDNPLTGGSSWDVSDTTVVASILPGGSKHELFLTWIDKVGNFMNSITTEDGVKVPILFRPWHEHTGSWFWWGQDLCSAKQYKELWRMTYDRLCSLGVDNLLYAYSPSGDLTTIGQYLERYPGDDIIDLIGFDCYQFKKEEYIESMNVSLTLITEIGKQRNKAIAITETGYETIPDATWWTETILPITNKYPISYILVWRNARNRENHYYAPYPGQVSAPDFVKFYEAKNTLFAKDIKNLYKKIDNEPI